MYCIGTVHEWSGLLTLPPPTAVCKLICLPLMVGGQILQFERYSQSFPPCCLSDTGLTHLYAFAPAGNKSWLTKCASVRPVLFYIRY